MADRMDSLIEKLVNQLQDPDPLVRRNAVGALRLNGARAQSAAPALAVLLSDTDPGIRTEARRALARVRPAA